MYDQLITIIILNNIILIILVCNIINTESIFFKIGGKTRMPSLTGFIEFIIWGLSSVRQLEDKNLVGREGMDLRGVVGRGWI